MPVSGLVFPSPPTPPSNACARDGLVTVTKVAAADEPVATALARNALRGDACRSGLYAETIELPLASARRKKMGIGIIIYSYRAGIC